MILYYIIKICMFVASKISILTNIYIYACKRSSTNIFMHVTNKVYIFIYVKDYV
jgi:hypothetical protein